MKCFNHPEREAVATCQKCGKGLCRECAEKYTPCMCDTCVAQIQREQQQQAQSKEEQRKRKYKDALVDTRSEFIKTAVIGVVIGIILMYFLSRGNGYSYGFFDYVVVFGAGFGIPFGWKLLTYFQSFFPLFIIGSFFFWIIYGAIKVVVSIYVGVPAFIYQLIKTISAQKQLNKIK